MPRIRPAVALPLVAAALTTWSACQDGTAPEMAVHDHEQAAATRLGVGLLDQALARDVRRVTAGYSSITRAIADGFAVSSACVVAPGLGGMGYHWSRQAGVDPLFDPLEPEVLLYEPQPDGRLELVGIEYIVVDIGQPAPTFGGQAFDVGGTPVPVPHWSLHVWLFRKNPNGVFARFNPDVHCP